MFTKVISNSILKICVECKESTIYLTIDEISKGCRGDTNRHTDTLYTIINVIVPSHLNYSPVERVGSTNVAVVINTEHSSLD